MSTERVGPQPIDTSQMAVIHSFYRREFRLAAGLVRGVADGDTARAAVVADHLDFIGRSLHHHHTGEDELIWPLLLARVPEELAPIVMLMQSQHARVDGLLTQIRGLLPVWREAAGEADRDRLAGLYETLHTELVEHLDAEEQQLLPIAARNVSQAEWDALGEAGRASTPKSELALTWGMFAQDGDPRVLASMLAQIPVPIRWLLPRLAGRAFRRHALAVHGTSDP